jgi:hypothetical protein
MRVGGLDAAISRRSRFFDYAEVRSAQDDRYVVRKEQNTTAGPSTQLKYTSLTMTSSEVGKE